MSNLLRLGAVLMLTAFAMPMASFAKGDCGKAKCECSKSCCKDCKDCDCGSDAKSCERKTGKSGSGKYSK